MTQIHKGLPVAQSEDCSEFPCGGVVLNMSSATLNGSTLSVSLDAPSYTQGVAGQRVTTEWRK